MTDGVRLEPALLARLGVEPAPATLLQFSTAFCAPCRAVRRVGAEVAALLPGVRHVEVDAESHLDEVRALGIRSTPTLLIIDREGREVRRATGVPTKPHLIAALAVLLEPPRAEAGLPGATGPDRSGAEMQAGREGSDAAGRRGEPGSRSEPGRPGAPRRGGAAESSQPAGWW